MKHSTCVNYCSDYPGFRIPISSTTESENYLKTRKFINGKSVQTRYMILGCLDFRIFEVFTTDLQQVQNLTINKFSHIQHTDHLHWIGLTLRGNDSFWDDGRPFYGHIIRNNGWNKVAVWNGRFDDVHCTWRVSPA